MRDDDLDIELDEEIDSDEPTDETVALDEDMEEAELEDAEDTDEEKTEKSKVAPSVKPGFLTRTIEAVSAPFARIRLPAWDLRLFAWVLVALIIVAFLIMNWSPMRLFFFGLSVDIPRALAIVILIGIGFLAGWFMRSPKPEEPEAE